MTAKDSKPRKLRSIGVVRNWLATAETSVAESRRVIDLIGRHPADADGPDIDQFLSAPYLTGLYHRRHALFDQLGAGDIVADPTWHMLIDLFLETKASRAVTISKLCLGSSATPTTALRHIMLLLENGVLTQRRDPMDTKRIFISLAPASMEALEELFQ